MTTLIRGIDTDNYDGAVSVDRFRNLYDNHAVRFAIPGLEAGMPFADVQRDNAIAAGLVVPMAYKFLYWQPNDIERLKKVTSFGLPIAPDIEYGDGMPGGFDATVERMHEAKDALVAAGLFWGWYSSDYEWQRLTGNTQDFVGDLGWSAGYRFGAGVLPPEDWMPDEANLPGFGGCRIIVYQYADTCYDEAGFDLNAMVVQVPAPPVPAGIGAHYDDGSSEELWTPRQGKTLDGVGLRDTDGNITQLWPVTPSP